MLDVSGLKKVYRTDRLEVEAEDGVVKVDGPDHVHVDLTPDAALETSDRLLHGSQEAAGQKLLSEQGLKGPIKKD